MHHTVDVPPTEENYQPRPWQKPHRPNLTGTPARAAPDRLDAGAGPPPEGDRRLQGVDPGQLSGLRTAARAVLLPPFPCRIPRVNQPSRSAWRIRRGCARSRLDGPIEAADRAAALLGVLAPRLPAAAQFGDDLRRPAAASAADVPQRPTAAERRPHASRQQYGPPAAGGAAARDRRPASRIQPQPLPPPPGSPAQRRRRRRDSRRICAAARRTPRCRPASASRAARRRTPATARRSRATRS